MDKRTEFSFCPELTINEGKTVLINANIREEQREPMRMGEEVNDDPVEPITVWTADTVRVSEPLDYGKIVSAFVRLRYSADETEAIILNADDGNPEHAAEYEALQEWRKEAKAIAKQVLG